MSLSPDAGAFNFESLEQSVPGAFPGSAPRGESASATANQTLAQAVFERRSEYTRPRKIRIKIGTWNVAAIKGTEKDIKGWFIDGKRDGDAPGDLSIGHDTSSSTPEESPEEPKSAEVHKGGAESEEQAVSENGKDPGPSGDEIGIYALGLQEVVDVSSAVENFKPYQDNSVATRFKNVISEALPTYTLIAEQQLIGLLLLVYASPTVAPEIKSVSTTSVGTGLMGYMGNKGAVTARLVLGETTRLVFVNSHLSAGFDKAALDRRIWDTGQILTRTKFDPITDPMSTSQSNGETLGDEDFSFWFGDLNFRLEGMPGDDVRRLLTLHTTKKYGITEAQGMGNEGRPSADGNGSSTSSSSTSASPSFEETASPGSNEDDSASDNDQELDPASLQATLISLLPHDELYQQQSAKKAFHEGWREGPIKFLPTYKYDVGTLANFDSSEKRRCPSYCDRILYRTRRDKANFERSAKEEEEAKKKEELYKSQGEGQGSSTDDLLFDYDPGTDGDGYDEYTDGDTDTVVTREGFEDEISLEHYASHQHVLSSDHKPLNAIFNFMYDAVVPEMKAKVHQEAAREIDRAENEGRPTITVIIEDHFAEKSGGSHTSGSEAKFEGVNFGDVRYAEQKHRNITVANTGQVPAIIGFVDHPPSDDQSEGLHSSWLTVKFDRDPDQKDKSVSRSPDQYTLEPGDTCNIDLSIRIELTKLVQELNSNNAKLEDILVLRVNGGRDHFIPIRGYWLHTSLGYSIDKLIRVPEGGIRKMQGQNSGDGSKSSTVPGSGEVKWSAPRELFRLTESVEDQVVRTLAEWGMKGGQEDEKLPWVAYAGWPFARESWQFTSEDGRLDSVSKVINALDTDAPLDSSFEPESSSLYRVEVFSEIFLTFLAGFEDGVITADLWSSIEDGFASREKSKQVATSPVDQRTWILEILSSAPPHSVSFVLLISMLARVASEIITATNTTTERKSMDLPASPLTKIRRRTLSQDPNIARKQIVINTYAAIFSSVIIKAIELPRGKEKERRAREERMRDVIELFLNEHVS